MVNGELRMVHGLLNFLWMSKLCYHKFIKTKNYLINKEFALVSFNQFFKLWTLILKTQERIQKTWWINLFFRYYLIINDYFAIFRTKVNFVIKSPEGNYFHALLRV